MAIPSFPLRQVTTIRVYCNRRERNNDAWAKVDFSEYFDYKLIQLRCEQMDEVNSVGDISSQRDSVRSGLLRNLGGITDAKLYTNSLLRYNNITKS